jgi:uncharacterized protein YneF (UPF0154 family)
MTIVLTLLAIFAAATLIFIGTIIGFFGVFGYFSRKMKKELEESDFYE